MEKIYQLSDENLLNKENYPLIIGQVNEYFIRKNGNKYIISKKEGEFGFYSTNDDIIIYNNFTIDMKNKTVKDNFKEINFEFEDEFDF